MIDIVFHECQDYSKDMKKIIEANSLQPSTPILNSGKGSFETKDHIKNASSAIDERKTPSNVIFKDEIPYLKILLEYAVPFLNEVCDNLKEFLSSKNAQIFADANKWLFNWRNNPENNEKHLRKEFRKGSNIFEKIVRYLECKEILNGLKA